MLILITFALQMQGDGNIFLRIFVRLSKNLYLCRNQEYNDMENDRIQDLRTFAQKVYDVVEAYLEANDCTIYACDGVYVGADLEPIILNEADAEDPDRFYPLCSLIREDGEIMEADGEIIDEIASQYFFVR